MCLAMWYVVVCSSRSTGYADEVVIVTLARKMKAYAAAANIKKALTTSRERGYAKLRGQRSLTVEMSR